MRRAIAPIGILLCLMPRTAWAQESNTPERPPQPERPPRTVAPPPDAGAEPHPDAPPTELRSVLAPELPRGMTRVRGTIRPFFSMLGKGGGAIADLAIDHYFAHAPLRLSLEMSPLALSIQGSDGNGVIAHLRLGAAYVTDYIELGGSAGTRLRNFGGSGISMAGFLRLGALDGLKLTLTYVYVLGRNMFTGRPTIGMSNILPTLDIPISHRFTLFAEGGVSSDKWIYASVGLRHRMTGDGGPGSWFVSGSFGVAWIVDRPACQYPGTGWCTGSSWAAGPTLGLGLERRF